MPERLQRYRRAAEYPQPTIGATEDKLLRALGRMGYMAAPQFLRWLFSQGSKTYVQRKLHTLYHSGYIARIPLMPVGARGSDLPIYCLDSKGYHYLKALGCAPEGRFRASEQAEREGVFLRHLLAANDLLILAHLLERDESRIKLVEFRTDRELKRLFSGVASVVPDGWIDLELDGDDQVCVAWELDRNTERRSAFQRKIKNLLQWSGEPYREAFATESLTIAFVVAVGGARRLRELLTWTEAELTQLGMQHQADLFRFAAFNPASIEPTQAFIAPHWMRPFEPTLVTLIDW